jgi:hypothetical protein
MSFTNVLHGSKSLARVCKHGTKLALISNQSLKDYKHPWKQSTPTHILNIPTNQIKNKMIFFSIVGILVAFHICCLQTNNMGKLCLLV